MDGAGSAGSAGSAGQRAAATARFDAGAREVACGACVPNDTGSTPDIPPAVNGVELLVLHAPVACVVWSVHGVTLTLTNLSAERSADRVSRSLVCKAVVMRGGARVDTLL